jgi:hypothetical protein
MNDPDPGAKVEYSRETPVDPPESRAAGRRRRGAAPRMPGVLVWGLAALALAGAILLAATEFSVVVHITVAGNVVASQTGADRHSYALLLLAVLALVMTYGAAANRSRPAMVALVVLGLIAVGIALIGDAPHLHDVGVYGLRFDEAAASAQVGFYTETLGAVLLVVAGVMLLSLTSHTRRD